MSKWPYHTSTWQKLRKAKLLRDPLCYACQLRGVMRSANTVDHIKAISAGGHPFPPFEGLMSLCTRCHNEKTTMVDRGQGNPFARRFKGCDADGNPIDPGDDWFSPRGESEPAVENYSHDLDGGGSNLKVFGPLYRSQKVEDT